MRMQVQLITGLYERCVATRAMWSAGHGSHLGAYVHCANMREGQLLKGSKKQPNTIKRLGR